MAGSFSVDGRTLRVTNLDRVLYPDDHVTKAEVIGYYLAMAERLLPHVRGRPITRIRWPHGVDHERFYEKQLPSHAPEWLHRVTLQHSTDTVTYPIADEPAALAWLAQHNALELHVPQWRWRDERRVTDRLVLDLDPGPGVSLAACAEVARWLRELLDGAGLASVPVTSGSKGIHVYARWPHDTEVTPSTYAKTLAQALVERDPSRVTATMTKSERVGKVLIDWSQNNPNKTTITPYSLRGRARPFVAAPRTWDELADPELRHLLATEVQHRLVDADPLAELLD